MSWCLAFCWTKHHNAWNSLSGHLRPRREDCCLLSSELVFPEAWYRSFQTLIPYLFLQRWRRSRCKAWIAPRTNLWSMNICWHLYQSMSLLCKKSSCQIFRPFSDSKMLKWNYWTILSILSLIWRRWTRRLDIPFHCSWATWTDYWSKQMRIYTHTSCNLSKRPFRS